jgi:spermidine synthase
VISVSLLGVGAGATCSALIDTREKRPASSALALGLAASCVLSLAIQSHADPLVLGLPIVIGLAYVLGALPFVFGSWIVVRALRERPARSGTAYAADLAGAAAGSLGGYLGVAPLGVPTLYGVAAVIASAAALAMRPGSRIVRASLLASLALSVALFLWSEQLTPPLIGPGKDTTILDANVTRVAVRWDPLARVDVLANPETGPTEGLDTDTLFVDRAYTGPWPSNLGMFLDLGVVTPVLGGDVSVLRSSLIAAPYEALGRPSVLVIGPGGGIDIQNALLHGAARVDAVEVNRQVVALMRGRLASSSDGIYQRPGVRIFEDEARSFVRRSPDHYDLIAMTVVDSYTALASGSYALSESYLYTDEAFHDYYTHLSETGLIAAGRWYRDPPIEILRTTEVAARGFRAGGVPDVASHLFVLRQHNFGLVLAKRTAFDEGTAQAIRRFAADHGFTVAFDPLAPSEPFVSVIADRSPASLTDDRPFFFADEPTFRQEQGLPIAYVILYLALLSSAILSYVVLLLPQRIVGRSVLGDLHTRRTTFHAALVGFGFIAAEIVLLQRLTLYLGQPALALSLGLAGLLVGAAVGSALSTRRSGVASVALLSAVLLSVILISLGRVTDATLDQELPVRIGIALSVVAAAGVPLGAVFPRILTRAAAADGRLVQWAWSVNAAASVIGSIVAAAVAITAGFTTVGIGAVLSYALVALTEAPRARRAHA